MKKKIWIIALSATVLVGGAFGVGIVTKAEDKEKVQQVSLQEEVKEKVVVMDDHPSKGEDKPVVKVETTNSTQSSTSAFIGVERAGKIALTEVSGKLQKVELEHKNGAYYYEVDIVKDTQEYDILIDAYSGKVLTVKLDDTSHHTQNTQKKNTAPTSNNSSKNITSEQAIKIAAKHVNGTFVKVEQETEHGFLVYKVELRTASGEADVYVQATTGKIMKVKTKNDDDDDKDKKDHQKSKEVVVVHNTTTNNKVISREQAIKIAEKHVNGTMVKVEQETEHGVSVYKVELTITSGEADVYIQATTGKIIRVKTKTDDDDNRKHDEDDDDDKYDDDDK